MRKIIGIDPGSHGCLWVINETGKTEKWIDMPFSTEGLDEYAIKEFLKKYSIENTLIVLEKIFYSSVLKGKAAFQFGIYYGIIKGIILGAGYNLREVRPIVWKKSYGLISHKKTIITKDHSIEKACSLNPAFSTKFSYKKTIVKRNGVNAGKVVVWDVKKDGRAEAYLIAEFGRRNFLPSKPKVPNNQKTKNQKD